MSGFIEDARFGILRVRFAGRRWGVNPKNSSSLTNEEILIKLGMMQMISPNRKGKPFERMGRKAFDLMAVKAVYGGWVAEVGVVSYLTLRFIPSLLEALFPPKVPMD